MKHPAPLWLLAIFWLTAVLNACQNKPDNIPEADLLDNKIIIEVNENGVYQLPLADLQKAGLALDSLDQKNVELSQAGMAVPILIRDGNLIFYGQTPDGRYQNTRPYILEAGKEGLAMPVADSAGQFPSKDTVQQNIFLEENHQYESQAITADQPDPWFWAEIGRAGKIDIPVNIPNPTDGSGQLRLQLWGKTHSPEVENDHDLQLFINDQLIDTILWDGNVYYVADIPLPQNTLQPGENIITLSNEEPGAAFLDIMSLSWLDLTFNSEAAAAADQLTFTTPSDAQITLSGFSETPLLLDIRDPAAPSLLPDLNVVKGMVVTAVGPQGFKQPVSLTPMRKNEWRDIENQADLLIITTDALMSALEPLVMAREEEGLAVAVVPIAEIYQEFGHAQQSPEAITIFLSYALDNWQTPPKYLLLVGEATSDYRGYANEVPRNHIPSPMVPVAFSGETVSDTRLADVDGDKKPDLAVGRWPVDSMTEVEDLVSRTLAYEANTAVANTLFATDGSEDRFGPMAERIWQQAGLPETDITLLNGAPADEVTAVWNDGTWLTTYIGHGSLELWGKDNVFNVEAVTGLDTDHAPIVVQLTCLTGLFAQPGTEALAEIMLQNKNGPVLIVAATSLTLSNHQEPFGIQLIKNLNDPDFERMGDAFQEAKLSLDIEQSEGVREISDTFILLGDPSAKIVRP